jgi:hypothetical protein
MTVTKETAEETFAKAIEWHVVQKLHQVSIRDSGRRYSIAEFAQSCRADRKPTAAPLSPNSVTPECTVLQPCVLGCFLLVTRF